MVVRAGKPDSRVCVRMTGGDVVGLGLGRQGVMLGWGLARLLSQAAERLALGLTLDGILGFLQLMMRRGRLRISTWIV